MREYRHLYLLFLYYEIIRRIRNAALPLIEISILDTERYLVSVGVDSPKSERVFNGRPVLGHSFRRRVRRNIRTVRRRELQHLRSTVILDRTGIAHYRRISFFDNQTRQIYVLLRYTQNVRLAIIVRRIFIPYKVSAGRDRDSPVVDVRRVVVVSQRDPQFAAADRSRHKARIRYGIRHLRRVVRSYSIITVASYVLGNVSKSRSFYSVFRERRVGIIERNTRHLVYILSLHRKIQISVSCGISVRPLESISVEELEAYIVISRDVSSPLSDLISIVPRSDIAGRARRLRNADAR